MTKRGPGEVTEAGRKSPDRDDESRRALLSSLIFGLGLFLTVAGTGMLTAAVAAFFWSLL
jgi:hypothetical protein